MSVNLKTVKYLIKIKKVKVNVIALICVNENGHLDIVKYLVEVIKIKPLSWSIYTASMHGYLNLVKYWIENVKLKPDERYFPKRIIKMDI
jgi:hypothetical protein